MSCGCGCGCGCCNVCRTVCSDYVTDPCGFFPGHSWITCGSNFAPPHGWSNTGPFAPYRYGGGYGCC